MITNDQKQAILDYVSTHNLAKGVGTKESACLIAAINLALTGDLTDKIPECMSEVVGKWIIIIQDVMPQEMRNSPQWKSLLPLAAGTGRDREKERLSIILEWMWGVVLPQLQELTDKYGFGSEWRQMLSLRTSSDARAAARAAASAAAGAAASAAAGAAYIAYAVGAAASAAAGAAYIAYAVGAAYAAGAAGYVTDIAYAAYAAGAAGYVTDIAYTAYAAGAAADAAGYATDIAFWKAVNPCAVLEELCK